MNKKGEAKLWYRVEKKLDLWGWIMSLIGLGLMCYYAGFFGHDRNLWGVLLIFFLTIEYFIRVGHGRLFSIIYYNTVINNMYELDVKGQEDTFFVCAENEAELDLYMELHYHQLDYKIIGETHAESFVKTDQRI